MASVQFVIDINGKRTIKYDNLMFKSQSMILWSWLEECGIASLLRVLLEIFRSVTHPTRCGNRHQTSSLCMNFCEARQKKVEVVECQLIAIKQRV
jgi:hypothetical protein